MIRLFSTAIIQLNILSTYLLTASAPAPDTLSTPAAAASIPLPLSPIALETPIHQMPPAITPTPSTDKVAEQLPSTTPSVPVSPTASSTGSFAVSSAAGIQQTITPATTVASLTTPQQSGTNTPDPSKKPANHPSEWTVDEVVDWLKSKGFDQGVCDKFIGM